MNKTTLSFIFGVAVALTTLVPVRASAQIEKSVALADLDVTQITNGYGQIHRNASIDSHPLTIRGKTFAQGLGVHANSVALVNVNGTGHRFRAEVGVDDEMLGKKASVEFIISGDGKPLWKSGVMHAGDEAKPVDIDLRGVRFLKLEVTDANDGVDFDHADWAEAHITYTGIIPSMAPDPSQVRIDAGRTSLVFQVDKDKRLSQLFFGGSTQRPPGTTVGEAYSPFGERSLLEPALQAVHADGNTSTRLEFISQSQQKIDDDITQTRIELKDPRYPFFVSLLFKAYARESIIEQWVEIRHQEKAAVVLHRFASTAPSFGQADYYLTYYHGGWANEMNREEEKLGFGVKTLASRLGSRAHMNLNPSFLLSPGAPAQENTGELFGATFAYSGNFQFQFEVDPDHRLHTICGINPEASSFKLLPGKSFVTPSMIWGYSDKGRGELARQFARWGRTYGMRDGNTPRPILLNNWEATYFDFDENKLVSLFDGAKALGMELFLLDDGWFGNKYPRRNDGQGLGDWQATKTVLPHGLSYLTEEARKRGLRFGLWLEPEMVNPKSELFEKHPDWAIRQPGRELQLERNQLVLDLANPAVREWMFQTVDRLLTENPGITYIKWDCNRVITQPGSSYLKADEQSHLFIEYYNAYYSVLSRIAKKHPSVEIMNCSGGGGRVDYGALRLAHEFWPSDNTDPLRRISIQWEYEQFYPTTAIASHVTGWGNRPIKFAFDVAMSARLGMDMDIAKLNDVDKSFARSAIEAYKSIRPVVQMGDLYRIESPYDGARAAQMYVVPDKIRAVVFAWQMRDGSPPTLKLQGIDATKRYRVREINRKTGQASHITEENQVLEGSMLLQNGLNVSLQKQFDSIIVELTAE